MACWRRGKKMTEKRTKMRLVLAVDDHNNNILVTLFFIFLLALKYYRNSRP